MADDDFSFSDDGVIDSSPVSDSSDNSVSNDSAASPAYSSNNPIQNAIIAAAQKAGVDPSFALSVAERESNFNPNEHASKTIEGVFQMTKGLRDKYGVGDSKDPSVQAEGFMRYVNGEIKPQMQSVLGREPTAQELYLGHHFGPARAARMINGSISPDTPTNQVFTAQEMNGNPHFARAGTSGNLMASINADMARRMGRYGNGSAVASGAPVSTPTVSGTVAANSTATPLDYNMFGAPVSAATDDTTVAQPEKSKKTAAISGPDLSDVEPVQFPAIQQAMAPVVPQSAPGSGIPQLPSINAPKLPSQADILTKKPGLAGALSPMMGTVA